MWGVSIKPVCIWVCVSVLCTGTVRDCDVCTLVCMYAHLYAHVCALVCTHVQKTSGTQAFVVRMYDVWEREITIFLWTDRGESTPLAGAARCATQNVSNVSQQFKTGYGFGKDLGLIEGAKVGAGESCLGTATLTCFTATSICF